MEAKKSCDMTSILQLEVQENGIVPIQFQDLRPGSHWWKTRSESEGLRNSSTRVREQVEMDGQAGSTEPTLLSSTFVFYSDPQYLGWFPPSLVKVIFFTLLTDSNAISSGNMFSDTPRNNVPPILWASLNPLELSYKIKLHNSHMWEHKYEMD